MLSKKIAIGAIAGISLLAASAAHAHDYPFRGQGPYANYGHRHFGHHHYRYVPQRMVLVPAPAYYYAPPRPQVFLPPPQFMPPRPVIFGRVPVGHGARIGFRVRL